MVAPYPPGVMAKTNKSTKHVQGEVFLKVRGLSVCVVCMCFVVIGTTV